MAVLLVRHAIAKERDRWEGDDDLRPLTTRGERQAEALVSLLSEYRVTRIASSPSLRCVQTVTPLAKALGSHVDREGALAEGNGRAAASLIERLLEQGDDVVLCTHGDVIPDVMEALGLDCHRCAKGSTWLIDGGKAEYIPAP
jgi:8-oxo-dGTP diphosphatase